MKKFGCRSLLDLPLDLLILALTRLPHRQLLKCMFVSKALCSIIRQPRFIESYCMHNPICLLLSTDNKVPFGRSFYCCNLSPSGNQVGFFNLKDLYPCCMKKIRRRGVTEIINGLACYYHDFCAVLVNVFSGEVTRLPIPNILPDTLSPYFYFGFDPINCIYKLLCCINIGGRFQNSPSMFHVLTIGGTAKDLSWRMLPPFTDHYYPFLSTQCVSVNGSLFWIESVGRNYSYRIISFDLTREKFRSFMLPAIDRDFLVRSQLGEFKGRLSLLSCIGLDVIVLYTLEMDGNGNAYEWRQYTVILPVEFRGVTPIGNSHNGHLLFADLSQGDGSITPIYAYNHETHRFESCGAAKFPEWKNLGSVINDSLRISVVEHTIDRLNALISQFSPRS